MSSGEMYRKQVFSASGGINGVSKRKSLLPLQAVREKKPFCSQSMIKIINGISLVLVLQLSSMTQRFNSTRQVSSWVKCCCSVWKSDCQTSTCCLCPLLPPAVSTLHTCGCCRQLPGWFDGILVFSALFYPSAHISIPFFMHTNHRDR